MGCLGAAVSLSFPSSGACRWSRKMKRQRKTRGFVGRARAKFHVTEDEDPFLEAAISAASLRYEESQRSSPLFLDPYAGCFLPPLNDRGVKQYEESAASPCLYCISTKFIDDKLIDTLEDMDGLRQIVLLTDGMDTRPYRLNWPQSTIIYDVSPGRVFSIAYEKLRGIGVKISRTCMLLHVPLEEAPDIHQIMYRKGFNGSRSSIWVFQGLPVTSLQSFKEILFSISSLAAKGSLFIGEFPMRLAGREFRSKIELHNWIDRLFLSYGFQVNVVDYDELARAMNICHPSETYLDVLFVAQQLQLSDIQMENWRQEFLRLEEEGDEEGFEEL